MTRQILLKPQSISRDSHLKDLGRSCVVSPKASDWSQCLMSGCFNFYLVSKVILHVKS